MRRFRHNPLFERKRDRSDARRAASKRINKIEKINSEMDDLLSSIEDFSSEVTGDSDMDRAVLRTLRDLEMRAKEMRLDKIHDLE